MSNSITCDVCSTTLVLKPNGDDEEGDIYGWVKVSIASLGGDACTRTCAHLLIDKLGESADANYAMYAEMNRDIKEDRERRARGEDLDD